MPIARHFLGWGRPCLHATVEYLAQRFTRDGELNLRGVSVVLPVARAARRLEELLLECAEQRGLRLLPPRLTTVGHLAELIFEPSQPVADDLTRHLVWSEALRELRPELLESLFPRPPQDDDLIGWAALGRWLDTLYCEVAGECLGFADVVEAAERLGGPSEAKRWRAAAAAQRGYLQRLPAMELCDAQEARLAAIRDDACRSSGPIVLIASDLTGAQCRMIAQVAQDVTALIFAPQTLAQRFDEFGNFVPAAWCEAELDINEDQWLAVDRPADQAEAVLREIASYGGGYAADQISIGAPDASVVPQLEHGMRGRGLPLRNTGGTLVARTAPYRFLTAAADYLEGRRFADLATLLRHPDVERWVVAKLGPTAETRRGMADWFTLMDRYYSDHLHGRLSGEWLGSPETRAALERVHRAIGELLGPLVGSARVLRDWAEPIQRTLVELYAGAGLDPERHEADRLTLRSCESIHGALQSLHDLPGQLSAAAEHFTALRLVLRQVADEPIVPEPDRPAVELLGWLELSLDDAPALIVTGFNEGMVPTSLSSDPLLPDSLRRQLGLRDNDHRYARDAYLLSAILASRPKVKLIAGRWSAEGEPLAPSRLLLACGGERLPRRVRKFYQEPSATIAPASRHAPAEHSAFIASPPAERLVEPITRMRVTAFRDYLNCPYRFYLRHVLHLDHLDDAAEELDGGKFGDLAHKVLAAFGKSPEAASTDTSTIARKLNVLLDQQAEREFGSDAPVAVRVQVEQLRARLGEFARRQVMHAAEGWVIKPELVEQSFEGGLEVDGRTMKIEGRIDRIDFNPRTGEYMVLDYKTGDRAQSPDDTHRHGEQWTDLQLPLYHLLAGSLGIMAPKLGYVLLPRDPAEAGFVQAEWGDELAHALEEARRVVRCIWNEEFTPAQQPPKFDDFADICGVGHLVSAMAEGEDE